MNGPALNAAAAAARLARALAVAATLGLLALALCTAADVTLRYLFARPIPGFIDVAALAGAVLLAACMPHVVACRGNIAVDFVGAHFGPAATRRLNRFGALVTATFFALMAWQFVRYAIDLRQTGETMAVLRWPVWPWWGAVALCIALAALTGFATLGNAAEEAP